MGNSFMDMLREGLLRLMAEDPDIEELAGGRFDEILTLLKKYIEEIELFNPLYGLVGATDRRELAVKHILDSLCPAGIIFRLLKGRTQDPYRLNPRRAENAGAAGDENRSPSAPEEKLKPVADVGSGAGLPGIPLAIVLGDVPFTLIERAGKRAGFLRNTLALLGLPHLVVEEGEMEKAEAGGFSLVVFRAFRPLEPPILKGLFRLLAPGGVLAAYKGRGDNIKREMEKVEKLTGSWEALSLAAPFLNEERHLVIINPPPAC
jgi:16S rRNA (guanine527-N7)-methyltransferase